MTEQQMNFIDILMIFAFGITLAALCLGAFTLLSIGCGHK